ncbi:MAG: DUF192 domain-containing protein [Patescibacteria group bacterium]|nr:DUF192 domain-containing protein [Patescibacteria group bacterium]
MIKNKTKNKVISENFVYLKGFFSKSKGLIGKSNFEAVIFTTRFGVHTFGLKFPIDVLILDNERKIVFIKERLKPNRVFLWNPKYNLVIELRNGAVKKSKTEIGDLLEISL